MKLTARLALSQLKVNKRRTIWTTAGIVLSTAMITTVYGLGFGSGIDMLDRLMGDTPFRSIYDNMINGLAFFMSVIILAISVVVISNAFRVSAAERSTQFGILKSTGATVRQITQTVVYEGIFLTIFTIPLGIVFGTLVQFAGVEILEHFLWPLVQNDSDFHYDFLFRFVFSGRAIWMSVLISAATVFISAWLPARKAAKVPAINAIRGIGEVKIKNKKVRTSWLFLKIFKLEGMLAAKFLKRSSRNFRATVIAMSFSIIIFIVAGGFLGQMNRMTDLMWGESDANVRLVINPNLTSSLLVDCEDDFDWSVDVTDHSGNFIRRDCFVTLRSEIELTLSNMNDLTERLHAQLSLGETLLGMGELTYGRELRTEISVDDWTSDMQLVMNEWRPVIIQGYVNTGVQMTVVDAETHSRLVDLAGVGPNDNILINGARYMFENGQRIEFEQFNFSPQTLAIETLSGEAAKYVELHGVLGLEQLPFELVNWSVGSLSILVPESFINNTDFEIREYNWFINTTNSADITYYGLDLLTELNNGDGFGIMAIDLEANQDMERALVQLVSTLTYAFVGALVLIGMTNVISTISENIKTRSNEFAILQSVGMTGHGIKRMLNLESIFSSAKALLIGVPLGILGTVITHNTIGGVTRFSYTLPWMPILIAVVAVFAITWITMQHAANKLRKQNIIETIRSGSGR